MAVPTFTRNRRNVLRGYGSGYMWIAELDGSDAITGAWSLLTYTKGWTLTQEVEEQTEQDDSGEVFSNEVVTNVYVEGQFLPRDEKVRLAFTQTDAQTFKDKFYAVAWLGTSTFDGATEKKESYVFYKVRFSQAIQGYAAGTSDAKFNYKFIASKNSSGANVTRAYPTDASWTGETTATGNATIAAGEWYVTDDLATS